MSFSCVEDTGGTTCSIDTAATLLFMESLINSSSSERQQEFEKLRAQLSKVSWISDGSVEHREPGTGGAPYQWTRKVNGKTVCVTLSKEQFEWLKVAIANWRALQETIRKIQRLSREELFTALPNPIRRKKLSKKTLGIP
jgi:hypothetical protein